MNASRKLSRRLTGALLSASTILGFAAGAAAEYPERPITLVVPFGAGGGTDATGRMIASVLQKGLGQPVTVVNRTGGSGVVGHTAVATAEPDGYTIGVITGESGMMHWAGLTDLTYEDFTPIALYNYDPAGFQVAAGSPWNSINDVIADVKANPGTYKAGGAGQGAIWHLAMAGVLAAAGADPTSVAWVPSAGAAPGLQELMAGALDFVPCSVVEARALIEAGKVRALVVMDTQRLAAYPDIPTIEEAAGFQASFAAWRGIAGPKGLPDDVKARLTAAMEKVYNSDEFQSFMKEQGFGLIWASGDDFVTWQKEHDADYGKVMKAVGLAKE